MPHQGSWKWPVAVLAFLIQPSGDFLTDVFEAVGAVPADPDFWVRGEGYQLRLWLSVSGTQRSAPSYHPTGDENPRAGFG
jgi:hypothetical protein